MCSWARSVWVGLVLLTSSLSLLAASKAEDRDFNAARSALNDAVWDRAEREFGAYVTNYPKADNHAEAVLFQGVARVMLRNFSGAIETLDAGRAAAGPLADEYLFWLAEAQFQSGKLDVAADLYAKYVADYPNSPRRLAAVVSEATARGRLKQWGRVTEILQRPDGVFQTLAKKNPAETNVVGGYFLLARSLSEEKKFKEAEAALAPLMGDNLNVSLAGERDRLLESIQRLDGRVEQALATATHLVSIATNDPALLSEGLAARGRDLEMLGRKDEAVAAWRQILERTDASAERQREALVRVSELYPALGRTSDALQTLETFLGTATNSPAADIAWLALGELRLGQMSGPNGLAGTNATSLPGTNVAAQAQGAFDMLLQRFPNSPLAGKAQLGRGWCLWLGEQWAASEVAFEAAAKALQPSYDQAVARFKLADARLQQTNYSGALINYREVVASGDALPDVRSNLVERALYQILQVAHKAGDDVAANEAMDKLLNEFPDGENAETGLLAIGNLRGQSASPRGLLEDFLKAKPDSKLAPMVRLIVARTYEQERNWPQAAEEYAGWVAAYPEHPARAQAEYLRALATWRAGDETNALTQFTNFVATFPTNEFTPRARWWVADHYSREDDLVNAERNYLLLFQNHPQSELRYEAQFMAGKAAFDRQRLDDAVNYFTNLTSDPNCDPKVKRRAMFAYGDTLMELAPSGTNAPTANYKEASKVFRALQQEYPNDDIAWLAEGKYGQCCFQMGAGDPAQYKNARDAFDKVLASKADISARSEAEWGLGQLMEKQSAPTSSTNQNAVLQQALQRYLNIIYGENLRGDEQPDPKWVKRAGLDACRVAESLQGWETLVGPPNGKGLCERLAELLPPLRPLFEKKKARAQEQLQLRKPAT